MTAHDFLERLEQEGLVDRALVAALRRKVSQPGKALSAEKVANYLVTKGHLTETAASNALADAAPAMRELTEDDLIGATEQPSPSAKSTSGSSKRSKSKKRSKRAKKEESLAMLSEADVVEEEEEVIDLSAASTASPAPDLADLGDLGAVDPLGMAGGGFDENDKPEEKKDVKSFAGKRVNENQWDSKWIFIGPTIVVVLAIAAGFIWFLLSRGDATENWNAFLDSYRGQRYGEAIDRGDKFLEKFPGDENAESVRVLRGIARIRIPLEQRDWPRSMEQLNEVLPAIKDSEKFSDVRDDVPFLILETAKGFAQNAEAATKSDNENAIDKATELVAEAEKTMVLAENSEYIPSSQRRKPVNEATFLLVDETIARVRHSINMERTLVLTLRGIDQKLEEGNTVEGFAMHKDVLRKYPELESDPRLYEAVLRVSDMERDLVRVNEETLSPMQPEPNEAVVGTHVIATQTGSSISSLDGEIAPLLLNGTVYAINAGDGRVIWRRFVGVATDYQPQWIDPQLKEDLLLVNIERQELIRVDARTGEESWTTQIGEAFAEPIIANQRAYLATRGGHLIEVDLSDGSSGRRAVVPQSLYAGPATGPRSKFLFQPGLHSNIYKLSATSLDCQEVFYLGHAQGSIEVPPVMASGYLFVAENSPAGNAANEYCQIHILLPQQDGIVSVQTPIRLEGKVVSPMLLYQRKVLVVTDLGDIALLDVDVTSENRPVTAVAQFKLKSNPQLRDFYAADNGRLFVADLGITGFLIQAQRGKLDRVTATNSGDVFVAPIHIFGEHAIHARIRSGSTLVSVSAVTVDEGAEVWRCDLAAPLAGRPVVDEESGQVTAVSAQGDQFLFDTGALTGFSDDDPVRRGSTTLQDLVFHNLIDLGQGRAIGFGPGQLVEDQGVETRQLQCLAIDPGQPTLASRIFSRPISYQHFGTAPVKFGDAVLLASATGQVFMMDPISGRDVAAPFQPAIEPGNFIQWCRPVAISQQHFVVADARGVLFKVQLEAGDQDALRKAEEIRYENRFVTPLAAIDQYAYVVAQAGAQHELVAFQTQPLEVAKTLSLPGRVTAGPYAVGDQLFVVMDDNKVHTFGADLSEQWTVDLNGSTLVGPPMAQGDELVMALNRGQILRVSTESGEVNSTIDVGEPITELPVMLDGKLIVGALDGTMIVLDAAAP